MSAMPHRLGRSLSAYSLPARASSASSAPNPPPECSTAKLETGESPHTALTESPGCRRTAPRGRTRKRQHCCVPARECRRLGSGPAGDDFLGGGRRNQGGHFADHGQHQALVAVGKSVGVLLDLREEANFVLRKFAQGFLRFAVTGRLGGGETVSQRN